MVEDGVGQNFLVRLLLVRLFGVGLASHLVQERHHWGLWSLLLQKQNIAGNQLTNASTHTHK